MEVDETMENIVVVDDDKEIAELLQIYLRNEGYELKVFHSGTEALCYLSEHDPDLLLLDVMIPDMDGFEILRKIRKRKYYPVIFISAKDDSYAVLEGLMSGGDDYIKKPFNPLEVLARIKGMFRMRKAYESKNNVFKYNDMLIDYGKRKVYINEGGIDLTETEYRILEVLSKNIGKIIETEELFKLVTGESYYNKSSNSMATHIRNIRLKLNDSFDEPKYIKTKWGRGYVIEDHY